MINNLQNLTNKSDTINEKIDLIIKKKIIDQIKNEYADTYNQSIKKYEEINISLFNYFSKNYTDLIINKINLPLTLINKLKISFDNNIISELKSRSKLIEKFNDEKDSNDKMLISNLALLIDSIDDITNWFKRNDKDYNFIKYIELKQQDISRSMFYQLFSIETSIYLFYELRNDKEKYYKTIVDKIKNLEEGKTSLKK